ncbi:hypothetical protein [Agromyces marinus]
MTIGPAGLAPTDVLASVAAHLGLGEPTLAPCATRSCGNCACRAC